MSLSHIDEVIETYTELKRLHQLNAELLEQLAVATTWLFEHNIPLPNAETLCSLFQKSKSLLIEIQANEPKLLQYHRIADEKKHLFKADGEVTAPISALYKGAIVFSELLFSRV